MLVHFMFITQSGANACGKRGSAASGKWAKGAAADMCHRV